MAGTRIKGISIEIDGETTGLQKSLAQVDKSLKNTQDQLKDVNKLLKLDPKNVELLNQKHQLLTKAVEDTKKRLDQLKEAQKQMDANGVDKNSEQYQALQREIISTEADLRKFTAQLAELESQAKKSGFSLEQFEAGAKKVSDSTRGLSTAAAGVGTAMLGMAYKAGTTADDLLTLSRNTGFSVEELQKMQYASDLVDVSMDAMTGSVQKLTKQMASGNKAFETLGVSITNADGSMRDVTDVWYDSLEALSQVENETLRDQLAMELFGKSAMDLSGIVDDGGEALKQFGQDAEDAGLILSEDAVSAAGQFNDAMDTLKGKATQAFFEAGASLAESLLPKLEELIDWVSQVISWFAQLDGDTQTLILTIAGLVAAISPIAGILSNISTMAGILSGAFTFLLSPVGLVTAAIAGVIAIGVALYKNWDTIKEKAGELWSTISNKFEAIRSAISDKIESAKEAVRSAIERIKSFFNFSWSLPHLKLPHLTVTGEFSLMPPKVPSFGISWYAKAMQDGMILNNPTIFGMQNGKFLGGGEAGAEVVVGASSLYSMIKSAVGTPTVSAPITLNVTVEGNVDDSDRFTKQLANNLVNLITKESDVFR
jgi:phage-related minor tail protein